LTQAIEGEGIKGEAGKIATGAGVGAILGGVLGGVKGAILGTVIGGGGITAATEGKQVELPQGSVLRVRLDSPVQIQTKPRDDKPRRPRRRIATRTQRFFKSQRSTNNFLVILCGKKIFVALLCYSSLWPCGQFVSASPVSR